MLPPSEAGGGPGQHQAVKLCDMDTLLMKTAMPQGQWQKTLPQRLESFVLALLTSSTDLRCTMSLQIFHLKMEGPRDPRTPRPFQWINMPS